MVELTLDSTFHALADPTRRQMLDRLQREPLTVSELATPLPMSLAAASKHIRVLESAGLVTRQVVGRTHHVRLNAGPLEQARNWLQHYEQFWTQRLDALEHELIKQKTKKDDKS